MSPPVAIVVLNHNKKNDVLSCLASVSQLAYRPFEVVVVEELMGDANRVPATIRRKQLFADMMLLFHMHITGKGKSSVDIAKAAHVDLAVVKQMLTPLVELGLVRWEYRGNHASRHGSGTSDQDIPVALVGPGVEHPEQIGFHDHRSEAQGRKA